MVVLSTSVAKPIPATPSRITLIRHGATEWSRSGRHTGRTDLPLLPEGETEARELAKTLVKLSPPLEPALVLTSPRTRARRTCSLVGFAQQAEMEPALVEWDYGDYEGLTTAQIRQERPGWDLFRDGCPGGESPSDVAGRVDDLLGRLRGDAALAGREVLLVGHGHLSRVLAVRWVGWPIEEARHLLLRAAGFGRLGWEREWAAIEMWNC